MRGTLADAFRQATKSSLSLKLSSSTGSKLSRQLATTYMQHQQEVAAMTISAHEPSPAIIAALCESQYQAPNHNMNTVKFGPSQDRLGQSWCEIRQLCGRVRPEQEGGLHTFKGMGASMTASQ